MPKLIIFCLLLVVVCVAEAKSYSSSSSSRRSSSDYKSSSYKSASSYRSSKPSKPSTVKRAVVYVTNSSRCSGVQQPFVEYDWDDREYEYECHSGRKLNRNGECVCK